MQKIKIVTDSTSDIPKHLQAELNIEVLPLTLIIDGKEYRDGIDLTPQEFYDILEEGKKSVTSSCVAPGIFSEVYEKAWKEGYTDLINITINAKGSGTCQGAVLSREMFYENHPEAKENFNIHIIDSKTYSMCYGWAVIEAARMNKEGKSVSEIIAAANDWLENVHPLFVPFTLKYVKKSGRVSAAAAFVGDALGLKPVITFQNGDSAVISKIRGEKRVVDDILEMVKNDRKPGTPYTIVYGNNEEQRAKINEACREMLDRPPEFDYPVGSVICMNTGPDMIAIIYRR